MKKEVQKEHNLGSKIKDIDSDVLIDIYSAIREIRYGSIQIHIQDGKIIQIDKVNKVRMV
ncbi:MAG: YezD family protein [Candidatus Omnitrophica bacterium]|nr:YezD family protein [Candidatus Omnitrophota bacterium]